MTIAIPRLNIINKGFYHPLFDLQKSLHAHSIKHPSIFWESAAKEITWKIPFTSVYDSKKDLWFPNGHLNMSYNCLDRHVLDGRGDQIALIHDSPVTNSINSFSYSQLLDSVSILSGILRQRGIDEHSKVLIYMPAIPQVVISMLACARVGAPHVVVFGGFAAPELAIRLQDSKADVILSTTYGLEAQKKIDYLHLVNEAIRISLHKPKWNLIYNRNPKDSISHDFLDWECEFKDYKEKYKSKNHPGMECTFVPSQHPLYILHTSGSTGSPKGIVRQTGGYAVALSWSTKYIYGIDSNEGFWSASDVGWVVGHSYIVYGPLLRGAKTILYEGKPVGTPDTSSFFRVLKQHNIKTFFCAPTALRAIKQQDPQGDSILKHGHSDSLEAVFLAGERCDPDTISWTQEIMNRFSNKSHVEILDNWWSTEMGWPNSTTAFGLKYLLPKQHQSTPIFPTDKIGCAGMPVPGSNLAVMTRQPNQQEKEQAHEWQVAGPNVLGNVILHKPLPPGAFRSLLNDNEQTRYNETYFKRIPGVYDTSDAGQIDSDGFVSVMGRVDDVINVAGHRISTGSIEQVVSSHPLVAECCVIGANDDLKGQIPVVFIVLKNIGDKHSHVSIPEIKKKLVRQVCLEIGAFSSFKQQHVHVLNKLPKTRSGKIIRKCIRNIVNKEKNIGIPPTIEDIQPIHDLQILFSHGMT